MSDLFPSPATAPCPPFRAAVRLLDRRWAADVLRALHDGAARFGEVRDELPGVTDAVLATRLRELCAWGLVEREQGERRGDVRYRLAPPGADLAPVLTALEAYGARHHDLLQRIPPARR